MKTLVNGLSRAVQRWPWAVIGLTVIISLTFGALSGNFAPSEEANEAFAPDAPELAAAERISDLFGEETSTSVMQIIVKAEDGNVFSADGLAAVDALSRTITEGALADRLVQDRDPVVSFLTPVRSGPGGAAPPPATDDEVRRAFAEGFAAMPPGPAGFVQGMVPTYADLAAPSSDQGLVVVFMRGADTSADFERFQDESATAADEIRATSLPAGISVEPFSFELLFSGTSELQSEIGRLFGTAGLIIALVLALVFLIRPQRTLGRVVMRVGVVAVAVAIVVVVLPTLAIILDSAFPDFLKDWPSNTLFVAAGVLLLVMFLAWTFLDRSLRRTTADTVLTLVAILFAISWMNGIGYLLFQDQSPMAQILPILLIGLGVDYSIHVTSRYREEISGGAGVDDSVRKAIRTVGVALVLATITTAVGFLTNVFNEIPALREFGALAAIGIVASFLLKLTFVPAVRLVLSRRGMRKATPEPGQLSAGEAPALGRFIGRTSGIAKKAAGVAVAVSIVLGGVGAWGWSQLETKFSFLDFIPVTSPLRATFEGLVADFGGGFGETTQVLIEGDVATGEAWNAMVTSNLAASDTPNILKFGNQPSGTSPVSVIAQLSAPFSPIYSPSVGEAFMAAGGDPVTSLVSPDADMGSVFDVAWEEAPQMMQPVLSRTDSGYEAALFDFTTQAGESQAGRLRLDLIDDFEPVTELGLSAVGTSDEIVQDVVVTTLRDSQVSSLLLTLAAALVLLVANFWFEARRPMLGVVTTLPVVLVVMWSFGLMAAFGIPFGPVTATISALAIGIGIPYMIHITHRFLEDRRRYPDLAMAIESTLSHTGGALMGSAITTVAGFGILVTSTTIPFRQFGFVTAYTILLASLTAILVLPSMLVIWARWHQRRDTVRTTAA
ncbi:MAG: MMPL family transporter [bacterium]|nr:MMPL family transporter [bacterium]